MSGRFVATRPARALARLTGLTGLTGPTGLTGLTGHGLAQRIGLSIGGRLDAVELRVLSAMRQQLSV